MYLYSLYFYNKLCLWFIPRISVFYFCVSPLRVKSHQVYHLLRCPFLQIDHDDLSEALVTELQLYNILIQNNTPIQVKIHNNDKRQHK